MNSLRMPKLLAFLCFGLPLAAALPVLAAAQTSDAGANHTVRNIVLVHGAWANGSSWSLVIPLFEARGFTRTRIRTPSARCSTSKASISRSSLHASADLARSARLRQAQPHWAQSATPRTCDAPSSSMVSWPAANPPWESSWLSARAVGSLIWIARLKPTREPASRAFSRPKAKPRSAA